MKRMRILSVLASCIVVCSAQAWGATVEETQKRVKAALAANTETAVKLVNDDMPAVRYVAIKKLCEARYDKAQLVPILMKALGDKENAPIRILAIEYLAQLKVTEAAKPLCEMILSDAEERMVKLGAEDALATILSDFPPELKDSLAKAVKKEDSRVVEDPEATAKALEQYKTWYKKRFGG